MMNALTLLALFLEGIAAFISPCILPMLPIYLVYLAGENGKSDKKRLLINTLGFVSGFTIIFVLLGATATGLGSLLSHHHELLQKVSGAIIIIFGLNYLGILKISFLNAEIRPNAKHKGLKFLSSMLFGMAFSLGWTPCVGSFLGSAMLLAANESTVFSGIFMLFVFSMGLGIPFMITAVIFDKLTAAFDWIKRHYAVISRIAGGLLLLTGLALLFNFFGYWQGLFS